MLLTDGLGRVTHTIVNYADGDPSGDPADVDSVTQSVYDAAGRRVATIDARGRETRFTYDLLDRLVAVTENATDGACALAPCNVVTLYTYDRLGNRTAITNPRQYTRRFAYDAADRMVAATDALERTTAYHYDKGGRLIFIEDPRGPQDDVSYSYDGLDRLIGISATNLPAPIAMQYNGVGWRTALSDHTGTTAFGHDQVGRLTSVSAPGTGTVEYAYDAAGRRIKLTYPTGSAINYRYWPDGQLKEVVDGGTVLASYIYDPAGRLDTVTHSNGVSTAYTFDGADRLTERHTTVGGTTRAQFTYTLDRLGLRTGVSETVGSNTRSVAYSYDGLLRLDTATESPGTHYDYAYDLAGNRTLVTVNNNLVVESHSYDAADQVIGWGYDAAGNLLGDGNTTYTYDALGRQTARGTTSYVYNGDGVLVSETTSGATTSYTQDLAAPLSQVLMTGPLTHVYGHERLFSVTPQGKQWYTHDGIGSVRQLLDDSGGAVNSYQYDPWGVPANGTALGFGFTGELQTAAGDTYLRARWYDAGSGRFPAARWRTSESFNDRPYSHHVYAYALSNPINWTDPTGKCTLPDGSPCPRPADEALRCGQPGQPACPPPGAVATPTPTTPNKTGEALLGLSMALAARPSHPLVWAAAFCVGVAGLAMGAGAVAVQTRPQTEYVVAPMELVPAPQTPTAIPVLVPSPTPDDSIIVFHYTSLASAQAIATSGIFNAQTDGLIGYGMYVTNYDHQAGHSGYRLSKQELQFGLRGIPKWRNQPVEGFVKLRIPIRLLSQYISGPNHTPQALYGISRRGGSYPDVTIEEQKMYSSIRKNYLLYTLLTGGKGLSPESINISQYVIGWGSTQFR